MQPTVRIARRCAAWLLPRTLLLPRALPLEQTDGRTKHFTIYRKIIVS